ncbi:unnamed protein product [Cuscuta campestris]|uniref:Uncharacterized protein n=1 Tax=Cuscuta campestris TaxID=132261 RepID=A0A484MXS3_9ASTE|nr:unnamed protein product [Cuscuta campestris]
MRIKICRRLLCHLTGAKLLLLLSAVFIFYLLCILRPIPVPTTTATPSSVSAAELPLPLTQILFSIAGSSSSYPLRTPYLNLWYKPNSTNAVVFLDNPTPDRSLPGPPIFVSSDTARFPYTFSSGKRSAIRVARIVRDTLDLELKQDFDFSRIRWFVFGDDDTVFFPENVARILSKYDDRRWYYIGCHSESYEQNAKHSFDMAFGGGGFAISAPLARVLARVMDSCLFRYPHLYGSDGRIFACLAELGVSLTRELGFHQVDVRGDIFGILSAHPLSLAASLHHLDKVDPIFPNMSRVQAMEHLFKAVRADSARIFQQSVCYDRSSSLTVSVSWGYSVQVYKGDVLLPDLLRLPRTFRPWRGKKVSSSHYYMFNARDFPGGDPCEMPDIFYFHDVLSETNGSWTSYVRHNSVWNCERNSAIKELVHVKIFSGRSSFEVGQEAPRRCCCDISSPAKETLAIGLRDCGEDELIGMHA